MKSTDKKHIEFDFDKVDVEVNKEILRKEEIKFNLIESSINAYNDRAFKVLFFCIAIFGALAYLMAKDMPSDVSLILFSAPYVTAVFAVLSICCCFRVLWGHSGPGQHYQLSKFENAEEWKACLECEGDEEYNKKRLASLMAGYIKMILCASASNLKAAQIKGRFISCSYVFLCLSIISCIVMLFLHS